MKLPILSVKDRLIGFGTTFTAVNEDVAIRGFTNSVKMHIDGVDFQDSAPEDLILFKVGTFDSSSGVVTSCEPKPLVYGHELITLLSYGGVSDDSEKI